MTVHRGRLNGWGLLLTVVAATDWFSCGSSRTISSGASLWVVQAPRSEDGDRVAVLVDGEISNRGWYCSGQRGRHRYELMFADGESRAVSAVGFVASNMSRRGPGRVIVRVQSGYGVTATGHSFQAIARSTNEQLQIITLPSSAEGDHISVWFPDPVRDATARCLGEFTAYSVNPSVPQASVAMAEPYTEPEPTRPFRDAGIPVDSAQIDAGPSELDGALIDIITPSEGDADIVRANSTDAQADTLSDTTNDGEVHP